MDGIVGIIVIFFVGILLFLLGYFMWFHDRKLKRKGRKTLATVVDILEEEQAGNKVYTLVLEFRGQSGEMIQQTADYSSGFKPKKAVPYKTEIYHITKNGRTYTKLSNNKATLFFSWAFMIAGLGLISLFIQLIQKKFS